MPVRGYALKEDRPPHDRLSHEFSRLFFERAQRVFPGGVNAPVRSFRAVGSTPFVVSRAAGAWIFDVDGNGYVDYTGSWGASLLGHSPESVTSAIQEQLSRGLTFGACAALETELAELVLENLPGGEMLRFMTSRTEAVMTSLRLARAFTGRDKIMKFSGVYHGHVDTLLVEPTQSAAPFGIPNSPGVLRGVVHDTLSAPFNDLGAVRTLFSRYPGSIAAIIVEPVVSGAGLIAPRADFLPGLRALADQFGALLIYDESFVGYCIHPRGAAGLFGVRADLTILGRAIGGGLPMGAIAGRADVLSLLAPLGPVFQSGTLAGNPLSMAAGIATLREWQTPGTFEAAAEIASGIATAVNTLAAEHRMTASAVSLGTLFSVFFASKPPENCEEARLSNTETFRRFFHFLLERGIYLAPTPFEACSASPAHAGEAAELTLSAIGQALRRLGSGSFRGKA